MMDHTDLYLLRETYNQKNLLLCFNGPFSQGLIEELGVALRNHLQNDAAQVAAQASSTGANSLANLPANLPAALDVFAVYIELTQNIQHYSTKHDYSEVDASATVVIGRNDANRYVIMAGNVVEPEDGRILQQKVEQIAAMDKTQLRAAYKEQLRKPRETNSVGAGLGLIDIARKAHEPFSCSLRPVNTGARLFFSLRVVI